MRNINYIDRDSLWRRAFKLISAFGLFLPAVLTAEQTNLILDTQVEGTNSPDPQKSLGMGSVDVYSPRGRLPMQLDPV